jgi:putative redox protein
MTHASADIGTRNYATRLSAGTHELVADERPQAGGGDTGATPHEILCAALAACTAITLRMYAQRKLWSLQGLQVDVDLQIQGEARTITRRLRLTGDLSDAQRLRLADIAERTPVTVTLKRGAAITTVLEPAVAAAPAAPTTRL